MDVERNMLRNKCDEGAKEINNVKLRVKSYSSSILLDSNETSITVRLRSVDI